MIRFRLPFRASREKRRLRAEVIACKKRVIDLLHELDRAKANAREQHARAVAMIESAELSEAHADKLEAKVKALKEELAKQSGSFCQPLLKLARSCSVNGCSRHAPHYNLVGAHSTLMIKAYLCHRHHDELHGNEPHTSERRALELDEGKVDGLGGGGEDRRQKP